MRTQTQKPETLPSGTYLGKFQILRPLNASGGMATLYLAEVRERYRRPDLPVQVALKVARTDYQDFLRTEAHLLAQVGGHQHIVKIIPLPGWNSPVFWAADTIKLDGHSSELCYLAMEYVAGTTLRKLLQQRQTLSPYVAVGVARQVSEALQVIHQHGIVHLDLKPENILLRRRGTAWLQSSVPEVVVCDFGIARDLYSQRAVERAGSPDYLAPEVLQEANPAQRLVSFTSDVYMVGEILYEMLTGRLPFDDVAHKLIGVMPHSISQLRPDVPPPLAALILKTLERTPHQRPVDADALLHELNGIIHGPDWPMVARRVTAGALAAVIVGGSIGLGNTIVTSWPTPTPLAPITITRTATMTPTATIKPTLQQSTVTLRPTYTPSPTRRPMTSTPTGSASAPPTARP